MNLEFEFTYRAGTVGPHEVGDGGFGGRTWWDMVPGGVAEGERFKARSVGGGADWPTVGRDGFMRVNMRFQLQTDDGAAILVHLSGPSQVSQAADDKIKAGEEVSFDDAYIRCLWHMETGDTRYAWINQSLFVSEARFRPTPDGKEGIEHRVHRVT